MHAVRVSVAIERSAAFLPEATACALHELVRYALHVVRSDGRKGRV